MIIVICVHLRLTTYVEVMRDCGVAPLRKDWLTLACAVTLAIFRVCWICSVMDFDITHQSIVNPPPGRPDTTATNVFLTMLCESTLRDHAFLTTSCLIRAASMFAAIV
jgi:hypothetical protein